MLTKFIPRVNAAIKRIEKGWIKGIDFRSINGIEHVCLYSSLLLNPSQLLNKYLQNAVKKSIHEVYPDMPYDPDMPYTIIAAFNDHVNVTKSMVIKVLKHTLEPSKKKVETK